MPARTSARSTSSAAIRLMPSTTSDGPGQRRPTIQGQAVASGLLNNIGLTDGLEAFEAIVGTYETLAALLAGLTPPPGDEAVVAELVGGYTHVVGLVRPVLDAGGMFPTQAALDAWRAEFEAAVQTQSARLDAYGLGSCS